MHQETQGERRLRKVARKVRRWCILLVVWGNESRREDGCRRLEGLANVRFKRMFLTKCSEK